MPNSRFSARSQIVSKNFVIKFDFNKIQKTVSMLCFKIFISHCTSLEKHIQDKIS